MPVTGMRVRAEGLGARAQAEGLGVRAQTEGLRMRARMRGGARRREACTAVYRSVSIVLTRYK